MFTEDVDGGGATLDPERGRSGEVCGGAEQGVTVSEFVENLWKIRGKIRGKICGFGVCETRVSTIHFFFQCPLLELKADTISTKNRCRFQCGMFPYHI